MMLPRWGTESHDATPGEALCPITSLGKAQRLMTPQGVARRLITPPGDAQRLITPSGEAQRLITSPGEAHCLITPPGEAQRLVTAPGEAQRLITPPGEAQCLMTPPGKAGQWFSIIHNLKRDIHPRLSSLYSSNCKSDQSHSHYIESGVCTNTSNNLSPIFYTIRSILGKSAEKVLNSIVCIHLIIALGLGEVGLG